MAKNITVSVNTGNEANNKIFEVVAGSGKKGHATHIKAIKGARYLLEDPAAKKTGPKRISIKRVGKSLHVMLEGNTEADLIIDDYYEEGMQTVENSGLYGRTQDGILHEYITENTVSSDMAINLADGGKPVSQVLGEAEAGEGFKVADLGFASLGLGWIGAGAGAAAAGVAAGVAAATSGGGSGGSSTPATTPDKPATAPLDYKDNVGSKMTAASKEAETDDTTPGINVGKVPAGTTPSLYVDGVKVPATYDPATGTLSPNSPLSEGKHSITFTLSNSAGESGQSPAMTLTIDTMPPTGGTGGLTHDATNDTGPYTNDSITSNNKPTFSGTGEPGATVKVTVTVNGEGVDITTTVDSNGHWTTPAYSGANGAGLADGQYPVQIVITDKAGNTETVPADPFVIDTNIGGANKGSNPGNGSGTDTNTSATSFINGISNDSGFSATDFITNDATLLIKGSVNNFSATGASAGDQLLVEIKDNTGKVVATQYVKPDASGNWQLDNTANTLTDGKYTIAVHVVDLAGNKVKADADTQVLIIDTNQGGTDASSNTNSGTGASEVDANAASGSVAITGITQDSGFSASDFITADGTLAISGTSNFVTTAGDKVRVQIVDAAGKVVAQTYVGTSGNWTFDNTTAAALSDGNYTLKAAIVDAADNIVKAGTDKPLVISSTAAPTNATLAISAISDDTGTSAVDFITQDHTLTINGMVNNYDSTVHKLLVQVIDSTNHVVTSEANVTVSNGTWTLNNGSLTDGKYTIRAVLTSTTGTEIASTVATHNLAIDNAAGTNPDNGSGGTNPTDANTTAVLSITTIHDVAHGSIDSGSSNTDFITNDATLLIQGSVTGFSNTGGSAGDKVRVQIVDSTGKVVAQQYVTPDASGVWSLDNTVNTLADGKYTVKAVIVDAPGNTVNTETTHSLVIDTNQGGTDASSNPGNGDGTGSSSTDANAGSNVAVAVTGITTDTGYSATDFNTSDATLTISGTTTNFTNAAGTGSAGDKVRVQIVNAKGQVVAETYTDPVSGAWTFNNQSSTLIDGNYTLKAAIVDASGNIVKAAVDQALVIDSGNTPTTATLAISSIDFDSGVSATDFVTRDNTLTITGSTAGYNTSGTDKILVQVLNGSTVVIFGNAKASGSTWSYTAATLADGSYTIRAVYTSATGVEISPAQTHSLVIDTEGGTNPANTPSTDPNAGSTVTVAITGITDDSGVSATDLITADQTLVISGNTANFTGVNGGAGDVVRVQIINTASGSTAGNRLDYVTVDASGNWSLDNTANPLLAGSYTLKADIVDKAGNLVKAGTDRILTVQTAIDPNNINSTAAVLVTGITEDTGASSSDFITADNILSFNGTVTGYTAGTTMANSDKVKVELFAANGTTVIATAYVDVTVTTGNNGTWVWPYQTLQADGNYSVRATLVNTAGFTVNSGASGTNTHAYSIDSSGGTNVDPTNPVNPVTPDANTAATVAITNISDDTGPGANDFVTKDTTLTYSGTVADFTANGDKVKVELIAADGTPVATAYVDVTVTGTNGTWVWPYQTTQVDGNYTVRATIVDVPGNRVNIATGGQATHSLVVDNSGSTNPDNGSNGGGGTDTNTTATAAITTIHDTANGSVDSGEDSTDFVTNDSTLVVKGTVAGFTRTGATAGDQLLVTILSGTTVVATQYVIPDSLGNWVMNNQANTLADGVYTINVDIVDLAGGTVKANAGTHSLVIDTNQGGSDANSNPGNGSGTDANAGSTVTVGISAISDDTGFNSADYITADHTLVVSGTTANFSNAAGSAGDKVRVQIVDSTGKVLAEKYVTPNSAGAWTADASGTSLPDGSYTLRNAIVDKAGNIVKAGADQPLVISSTAAPSSATVSIASITNDTGYDGTDFITQDNTLTINGATNGFTASTDKVFVQVLSGSTVVASGYATVASNGTWGFLPATGTNSVIAASLADGSYTIRAVLTNTAGVEVSGTAATHALVVDTSSSINPDNGSNGGGGTDPNNASGVTVSVSTIHDTANGSTDSGSSASDFITNDNTLIIKGTSVGFSATGAGALDKVRVQIIDSASHVVTTQYVTPDSAGNWAIDNKATTLADGKYSIQADIVDASGNTVKAGAPQVLVIDTNQGGTDNGSNPGNGSSTDTNTTVAISTVTIHDSANGSNDTGFSSSDFITADSTLIIKGTVDSSFSNTGASTGDKVRVQIVASTGQVIAEKYIDPTSGSWAFDNKANTLVDGDYTLKAAIVDAAGNVVKAATDRALVINSGNTPTTATLAISTINADTGISATDFITADNSLTISGTTDGFTVGGTDKILVQVIKVSDGTVVSSGYATHLTSSANANWTFVTNGGINNIITKANLDNGGYTLRAVYTSNTGIEISAPVTHSLVIDNSSGTNYGSGTSTVDPNASVVLSIDTITEDSGVNATDWLTNDNQLVINGSAPSFSTLNGGEGDMVRVQIYNGSTLVRESFVTVDATGHWALDNTGNILADGTYIVKAQILDVPGNTVVEANDQTLVIRTSNSTDPNNSATVAITDITTDTGVATDFITSDTTLTYSGTVANFTNTGDLVKLVLTNALGAVVATQYVTPTTTGSGAQNGTWQWAYQTGQSDGNYTLTATIVDTAGSRLNSAAGGIVTQLVTIDTSLPTQTVIITDILDNEGVVTGTVLTGGITDDTSLNLKGTVSAPLASDESVAIYDGSTYLGKATVSDTNWTFADSRTLTHAQTVSYTAKVVDISANAGPVSIAYTATVNTSVPSITIASIASDTVTDAPGGLNGTFDGTERGLNLSTVTTKPVISGTSTNLDGQTITVTLNGSNILATVGAGGAWSVELTDTQAIALNHGNTYQVFAAGSSTGGKVATDTNNSLVVNTATPDIPTVVNNYSGTTTPTLTGSAQKSTVTPAVYMALESGDTLTVTVGGATYTGTVGSLPTGLSYDSSTNNWSLNTAMATPTSGTLTLATGSTYNVGVSVVAGSVTKNDISTGELVINTIDPVITLNVISTDGYLNAAEKGSSLNITGYTDAQVGSTVTLGGFGITGRTATVLAGVDSTHNLFTVSLTGAEVTAFANVNTGSQNFAASMVNQYGHTGSSGKDVIIDISAPTFATTGTDVATAQNENIVANTVIYTAAATDTATVTYSLKASTGDVAKFSINSSTGAVKLTESPNFETKASYAFTVVATDAAGNFSEKAVSLAINNLNEAPTATSKTFTLLEDGQLSFVASDFGFADANDTPANTLLAVIITTLPTAGTLKLSGTAVTLNQSIAVGSLGNLVYAPAANANGTGYATIGFKVQDNGGGTANGGVDTSTTANTLTFNVTADNDAPVLAHTTLALPAVLQDSAVPVGAVGSLVSSLVGGATDVDAGAVKGIAITGVNNGTLYYSTNGGSNWTLFAGTASDSSALLLASDADNRIYLKPTTGYSGTANDVTFRAWDQTTGTEGSALSTSTNGGTTAFSSATDTITEQVVRPVTINTVSYDNIIVLNEAVPLSGTANPNATVNLTINGTARSVIADSSGNWAYDTKEVPLARYVMVRKALDGSTNPTGFFSIGELAVMSNGTNVAANKAVNYGLGTTSSGTRTDLTNGSGVSGYYEAGPYIGDAWVEVDLGDFYRIDSIVVTPRDNGWDERLNGAQVFTALTQQYGASTPVLIATGNCTITNVVTSYGVGALTLLQPNGGDKDPLLVGANTIIATEVVSGVTSSASKTVTSTTAIGILDTFVNSPSNKYYHNGDTVTDTTPMLQGVLAAPLTGTQTVAIWGSSGQLGYATVTGTYWEYQLPVTSVGSHTYEALLVASPGGAAIAKTGGYTIVIASTLAIIGATVNDTASQTTDEITGPTSGAAFQPYIDSIMTVQSYNSDGTTLFTTGSGVSVSNNSGSWGAAGKLFNGSGDVGLFINSTDNTSGNQYGKTQKAVFTSKTGSFSAVSFDYADLQDLANGSNNNGYTGASAGTVSFYKADNTLIQTVSINANTSGLGSVSMFNWSSPGASASYFTIMTSHDAWALDTVKFTSGADVLASNGTTVDTTPTLTGTVAAALVAGQVLSIYEGATLLGNATLSGTSWSYTVPSTSVGAHTYTAKIMSGTTVVDTSSTFLVNVAATPLALDMNGDGLQTVGLVAGVQFDLLNTGKPVNVGWVDKHDGLLVMDLNGDGIINNGAELFGDHTVLADGTLAKDGWAALSAQDSNHDGKIDVQDTNFNKLGVWVDANGNGSTDVGELHTLAEEHIASINLNHDNSSVQQNGNVVQMASSFTTTDGVTHSMADVGLKVQNATSTIYTLSMGESLDLSGLGNAAQVSGINMSTDSAANIVKLTLTDVLNTTVTNGLHQLTLTGDANDSVQLSAHEWTNTGTTVTESEHTYAVYNATTSSEAQLLIDQAMINAGHVM